MTAEPRSIRAIPLLIAALLLFTTCADTPAPVAPADDVSLLAKQGGQGGKVKTVTAAELGLEIVELMGPEFGKPYDGQFIVNCPAGKVAISGGYRAQSHGVISEYRPWDIDATDGFPRSWFVQFDIDNQAGTPLNFWAYAVCVNA